VVANVQAGANVQAVANQLVGANVQAGANQLVGGKAEAGASVEVPVTRHPAVPADNQQERRAARTPSRGPEKGSVRSSRPCRWYRAWSGGSWQACSCSSLASS
jgi:hypothetical protein